MSSVVGVGDVVERCADGNRRPGCVEHHGAAGHAQRGDAEFEGFRKGIGNHDAASVRRKGAGILDFERVDEDGRGNRFRKGCSVDRVARRHDLLADGKGLYIRVKGCRSGEDASAFAYVGSLPVAEVLVHAQAELARRTATAAEPATVVASARIRGCDRKGCRCEWHCVAVGEAAVVPTPDIFGRHERLQGHGCPGRVRERGERPVVDHQHGDVFGIDGSAQSFGLLEREIEIRIAHVPDRDFQERHGGARRGRARFVHLRLNARQDCRNARTHWGKVYRFPA